MSEPRRAVRGLRAVGMLACLALLLSCGGPGAEVTIPAVPTPDTDGMQRRVREVFTAARQRVVREPRSASAWGEFGEVCDAHELYGHAVLCYRVAHALAPDEPRWPYLLGITLDLTGGDPGEVTEALEAAARLKADYAPLYVRLGEALARQGRHDRAAEAYGRALELEEQSGIAARGLGQVLLARGEVEEAVRHLTAASEIAPGDRATLVSLARAHALEGRLDEARAITARLETLSNTMVLTDPIRAQVLARGVSDRMCRARAARLMETREFEPAIAELGIVLEVHPDDAEVHEQLGTCLVGVGRVEEAQAAFAEALRLDDSRHRAHLGLGTILMTSGRIDDATPHLQRSVELHPSGFGYARLGLVLAAQGRGAEAIACFTEAESMGAADGKVHQQWGALLLRDADVDGAIAHFQLAVERSPRDPWGYYRLGRALEQVGRVEEAIGLYRRAVALQRDHPAAQRLTQLAGNR